MDDHEDDYLAEAATKAKRVYLKEEITEMNYDEELFTDFFYGISEVSDLKDIAFDDLESIVSQFKKKFRPSDTLKSVQKEIKKREEQERKLYETIKARQSMQAIQNRIEASAGIQDRREEIQDKGENIQEIQDKREEIQDKRANIQEIQDKREDSSEIQHRREDSPEIQHRREDSPERYEQEDKEDTKAVQLQDSEETGQTEELTSESHPSEEKPSGVYFIPCVKATATTLSSLDSLKIDVSEAQIVKGGVFSSNSSVHTITTSPLGWMVQRTFSDFVWLRESLSIEYPKIYIPPIPVNTGKLDNQSLLKRNLLLEKFLIDLSNAPLAKCSTFFCAFLGEVSSDAFKALKKQKLKKKTSLKNLVTIEGTIGCDLSDRSGHYSRINNFLNAAEANNKKIKKEASVVIANLLSLSESLQNYADLLRTQAEIHKMIPESSPDFFSVLADSFGRWASFEAENVSKINRYCKTHFAYSAKETETLKTLMKDWENNFKKFQRKQTKDDLFAMLNYNCQLEVQNSIKNSIQRSVDIFSEMAKFELETSINFHHIWSDLYQNMVGFRHQSKI